MTEHVIFIVYRQVNRAVTALCWRPTEAEAIAVMEQIRNASDVINDDMTAPLMWVAPLSDVPPGLVDEAPSCSRDKGCQREDGHEGLHMSRYWNAMTSSEVLEEWDETGNREAFE